MQFILRATGLIAGATRKTGQERPLITGVVDHVESVIFPPFIEPAQVNAEHEVARRTFNGTQYTAMVDQTDTSKSPYQQTFQLFHVINESHFTPLNSTFKMQVLADDAKVGAQKAIKLVSSPSCALPSLGNALLDCLNTPLIPKFIGNGTEYAKAMIYTQGTFLCGSFIIFAVDIVGSLERNCPNSPAPTPAVPEKEMWTTPGSIVFYAIVGMGAICSVCYLCYHIGKKNQEESEERANLLRQQDLL